MLQGVFGFLFATIVLHAFIVSVRYLAAFSKRGHRKVFRERYQGWVLMVPREICTEILNLSTTCTGTCRRYSAEAAGGRHDFIHPLNA